MSKNADNNDKLRWYQKVGLKLLWGICSLMGYMPRWFRYGVLKPIV